MGKEKRMIGDYTVLSSVNVGEKEIIIASNEQSTDGAKFLCGFVERNDLFELCKERLTADRTHLRNEIRKVNIDDDLLSGKRQQISALSERLKELRKEVRLCDGIAERSGVMRENLNAVLADEEKIKNNRKENRDYEHRR